MRRHVFHLLEWHEAGTARRVLRFVHLLSIVVGIAATAWLTAGGLETAERVTLEVLRGFALAVFALEYAARLWSAPERPAADFYHPGRARTDWALGADGIVDLLALAPALPLAVGGAFDAFGPVYDVLGAAFWVAKLRHHLPEHTVLTRVLRNAGRSIGNVLTVFVMILVIAAVAMHLIEGGANPESFGSLPKAMWWSVVTLTTTGYGDEVPLTLGGRLLASGVMVCGISVLAILAGILATGYAEEMRRQEFLRSWHLVASVPYFQSVNPSAIAQVASILHPASYPSGATVVRRGDPGDKMYFIASGEVEVAVEPAPVRLKVGDFFGEIALITRRPRGATVTARTPVTLLVLDVADFLHLAGKLPELARAIEAAGAERLVGNDGKAGA